MQTFLAGNFQPQNFGALWTVNRENVGRPNLWHPPWQQRMQIKKAAEKNVQSLRSALCIVMRYSLK